MASFSSRRSTDNTDLIAFAIEHVFLMLAVVAAMWLVSYAANDSRDARVKAAVIATVLAVIGAVSELMQWSSRIFLWIAGDSLGEGGLPAFMKACVAVIVGAAIAAGIASAVPDTRSDKTDKVVIGFMIVAVVALVTMYVGECWVIGG